MNIGFSAGAGKQRRTGARARAGSSWLAWPAGRRGVDPGGRAGAPSLEPVLVFAVEREEPASSGRRDICRLRLLSSGMATVVLWMRNLLLVALATIAIAAGALLPLTFFDGYSRHSIAKRYRPVTDDEMQSIVSSIVSLYGTTPLLEVADMPAEQRIGRIAAVQQSTTVLEIGAGGIGLSRDTFPAIAYGDQYAEEGAPTNAVVRETHVGSSGYPRMGVPRADRFGWSWCGIGWASRAPYPSPHGPEGYWKIVIPLPLLILVSGAWPFLRLRAWLKARALRRRRGFAPVLESQPEI